MRLINVRSQKLETFYDVSKRPSYAILSHRWIDGEEVSFEDLTRLPKGAFKTRSGWQKIVFCCQQAQHDGLDFVWIDTCCIDKSSSAELSEAINSMYQWYTEADVCYAYLNDIFAGQPAKHGSDPDYVSLSAARLATCRQIMVSSAWFTRAWTLQELLAPRKVIFFDKTYSICGTKQQLESELEWITGVPASVLRSSQVIKQTCVARKMSWAANRRATRVEDVAYSLFGIFEVNLPLLYGEGKRAFVRLQEEIIRQYDDQTVFAWTSSGSGPCELFASSPRDFAHCSEFVVRNPEKAVPYSLTNVGLDIELPIVRITPEVWVAYLSCHDENSQCEHGAESPTAGAEDALDGSAYCMFLARISGSKNVWQRVKYQNAASCSPSSLQSPSSFFARSNWDWDFLIERSRVRCTSQQLYIRARSPNAAHADYPLFYGMVLDAPSITNTRNQDHCPYTLINSFRWVGHIGARLLSPFHCMSSVTRSTSRLHIIDREEFLTFWEADLANTATDTEATDGEYVTDQYAIGQIPLGIFVTRPLTNGITGALLFQHSKIGLQALVLAFDLESRPTVILFSDLYIDSSLGWLRQYADPYQPLEKVDVNLHSRTVISGIPLRRFSWFNNLNDFVAQPHVHVLKAGLDQEEETWHLDAVDLVNPGPGDTAAGTDWYLEVRLRKERIGRLAYWKCSIKKIDSPVTIRVSNYDDEREFSK